MKNITLFTLFIAINLNAQVSFQDHLVRDNSQSLQNVFTVRLADFDNDSDLDLLALSSAGHPRLFWYENIDGQGNYGDRNALLTGNSYDYIVDVGDFDNDGDIDIVYYDIFNQNINWVENIGGSEVFANQVVLLSNISDMKTIKLADVDNDNDLDILSTFEPDNVSRLVWYENTGAATLSAETIIDNFGDDDRFTIQTADIDGDNDLDIVLRAQLWLNNYQIRWYENTDGLGNFGAATAISTDKTNQIATTDLDGDGDIDIVASSSVDERLFWIENTDGLGSFATSQDIGPSYEGLNHLFPIDVDGDGDIDIVSEINSLVSPLDNVISWYENLGGTTFADRVNINTTAFNIQDLQVADISGDGNVDIVAASKDADCILINKASAVAGEFLSQKTLGGYLSQGLSGVTSSDLDGDGDNDVMVTINLSTGNLTNGVLWFENLDGLGTFGPQIPIDTKLISPSPIISADIDNDGDMDILVGEVINVTGSNRRVYIYENIDGNGNFVKYTAARLSAGSNHRIEATDINGDGFLDILVSNDREGTKWFENVGGTFIFYDENYTHDVGPFSIFSEASDIDNDGDKDVLLIYQISTVGGTKHVRWYENTDGLGTFSLGEDVTSESNVPISARAADIDGDGDLDIVVGNKNYDKIHWNENLDGLGHFGPDQLIFSNFVVQNRPLGLHLRDFDQDGDIDIITMSANAGKVFWYENVDGLGTFSGQKLISSNVDYPKDGFPMDIDGDGDLDFITATTGDDIKVVWHEVDISNLSVGENELAGTTLTVVPNPTSGVFEISGLNGIEDYKIYNMIGQKVGEGSTSQTDGINVSQLVKGIYFLNLSKGQTLKFIKN